MVKTLKLPPPTGGSGLIWKELFEWRCHFMANTLQTFGWPTWWLIRLQVRQEAIE